MIKKLKSVDNSLKIVVRGIMSVKDAVKAAEYGASAVWIHNDGSFFSASPSPISVLPYISKALEVYPDVEIFFQGGIRRGSDVLKAIAFGAKAVFLDTEFPLWGIHKSGKIDSLQDMMTIVNEELKLCMVLTHS